MSLRRVREETCVALTAFGYFTRIPVPHRLAFSRDRLARASGYLPLVGWLVGGVGAGVCALALHVWPAPVAVLLSMITTLLLTGALHEDGLADVCDGFGGGYRRDDILRIMKDSRVGAFGAIGLLVSLALKWQTLTSLALIQPAVACAWMAIGHAASRVAPVALMSWLDYVRAGDAASKVGAVAHATPVPAASAESAVSAESAASDAAKDTLSTSTSTPSQSTAAAQPSNTATTSPTRHWPCALPALVIGLPGLFWQGASLGITLLGTGALLTIAMRQWFMRRIGGYTGDCLGCAQQVCEIACYLIVLAWISS